jgi:hypothetical protein
MPPKAKGKKGKKADDDDFWFVTTLSFLDDGQAGHG